MADVVAIRPSDPEREYLRCSYSPLCKGPSLRDDHDEVCQGGNECTDDDCWRGCEFCIKVGSEH